MVKNMKIKKKSGRPPKLEVRTKKSLLSSAKNKVGQFTSRLGRKFGISYRKRKRAPKYSARQLEIIPKCCCALRDKYFVNGKFIVLDDVSYFTFWHHELSGNDGYYTDNFETTPDNVKYAGKRSLSRRC